MNKTACKHCQPLAGRIDFSPLVAALRQSIDWAFDAGAQFARDYPDEIAVIDRVRAFVHGALTGTAVRRPCFDDIAFAGALIIGALEQHAGDEAAFWPVLGCIDLQSLPTEMRPYVLQLLCAYARMSEHERAAA